MSAELRKILFFTLATVLISIGYYLFISAKYPAIEEHETILFEIGEGLGEIALWLVIFIYLRTLLKVVLGKGGVSKRLLPSYSSPVDARYFKTLITYLDRTHIYFGIAAIAVSLLHVVMVGLPMHILFFPAVLALLLWQGAFGMFISWRYSPKELRKFSYLVHAQLFTGIMMGVFAYFGHLLID